MSDPEPEATDSRAVDDLLVRHLDALHAFVRLRAGVARRPRESSSDLVQSTCREVLADVGNYRFQGEAAFNANALTIQPNSGSSSTWRTGNVVFYSGSMRGRIEVSGVLPPFIPVSTTLADWSKAATAKTLL